MDCFQKDVIAILHAALTGTPSEISSDFDLEKGVLTAKTHNIAAMFYYGALACGISAETSAMKTLFSEVCKSLMVSERQLDEIKKITEKFEEEKIEFLPLKGTVLKTVYPKPEMRSMGDADILIRLEQYPAIEKILSDLGFRFKEETDHELVWVKPTLFLELHKSVMTSYNEDFYRYFQTGWEFAGKVSEDSSRYELKKEDFYIYMFVHFTKHYRISGIGIKHIVDLWVYKNENPTMDDKYISAELQKLHLCDFYSNVISTLDVWFNGAASNEKTDFITSLIFSSGQYGTAEMAIINRVIRDSQNTGSVVKAKMNKLVQLIFLPYSKMCVRYPVLKKAPVLLPLMWCVRIVSTLLFDREKLKKHKTELNMITQTSIDEHQKALSYVGLNLNFEE